MPGNGNTVVELQMIAGSSHNEGRFSRPARDAGAPDNAFRRFICCGDAGGHLAEPVPLYSPVVASGEVKEGVVCLFHHFLRQIIKC